MSKEAVCGVTQSRTRLKRLSSSSSSSDLNKLPQTQSLKNNRNLFFHISGGWKFKLRVSAESRPGFLRSSRADSVSRLLRNLEFCASLALCCMCLLCRLPPLLSLMRACVMAFMAYPDKPGISHLKTLNHICNQIFQIKQSSPVSFGHRRWSIGVRSVFSPPQEL